MPRCLWLGAALLVVACGAPPPDSIVYSPCTLVHLAPLADTTEGERESVRAAVTLWREVGFTALTLHPPGDAGEGTLPLQFKPASVFFRGVYEPTSGLVTINRELTGSDRVVTVAHELGHAVGLPHVPAAVRPSVMNPSNLTVRPTPEDVAALSARWGCRWPSELEADLGVP